MRRAHPAQQRLARLVPRGRLQAPPRRVRLHRQGPVAQAGAARGGVDEPAVEVPQHSRGDIQGPVLPTLRPSSAAAATAIVAAAAAAVTALHGDEELLPELLALLTVLLWSLGTFIQNGQPLELSSQNAVQL